MITKPIDALDAADIAALVTNRVSEGRSLDYKEQPPGGTDREHGDFVADVASFANSLGGHIVYGVSEHRDADGRPTGVPAAVVGLAGNIDAEVLRLEGMARTSIDPRVPGIRFRRVPGGTAGDVLVCWIPKSWQAPHMVTFRGISRFYARGASGKYQMDVGQIRNAFIAGESLREAVRRFRSERVAKVASGEASPTGRFLALARFVLHVVPVSTFDPVGPLQATVDLSSVQPMMWTGEWTRQPLDYRRGQPLDYRRYNFDGVLGWTNAAGGECLLCVQVFRNGAIEFVDAFTFRREEQTIPSRSFEERVMWAVGHYLVELPRWGIGGPFLVMLSLVNVMGYRMATGALVTRDDPAPIDREIVIVPELWLEEAPSTAADLHRLLKGTLDIVWQCAGFRESPNFTPEGVWSGQV